LGARGGSRVIWLSPAEGGKPTNPSDRQRFPPYGLLGGAAGALGRTVLNPGSEETSVPGKASREFNYGDVISFQQSGARGYRGPPDRDPAPPPRGRPGRRRPAK